MKIADIARQVFAEKDSRARNIKSTNGVHLRYLKTDCIEIENTKFRRTIKVYPFGGNLFINKRSMTSWYYIIDDYELELLINGTNEPMRAFKIVNDEIIHAQKIKEKFKDDSVIYMTCGFVELYNYIHAHRIIGPFIILASMVVNERLIRINDSPWKIARGYYDVVITVVE